AVVVVVARCHSHSVGVSLQPGGLGDVSEATVAIVVIEAVPKTWVRFVRQSGAWHRVFDACAIHEEQIEPSVVIVVQHGDPRAHGFWKVFLTGAAGLVFEANAGLGGYVFEQRWESRMCQRTFEQLAGRYRGKNT